MKNGLRTLLILAALIVLTGCLTPSDRRCARLPGGGAYCLQPSSSLPPFDVQQIVDAVYKERRETLVFEMESDTAGLRLAGLTPLGHKLLHVTYDNREARVLATPTQNLDPVLMVALVQLTLWPADVVRQGLKGSLTLEETAESRRILNGAETVISIRRVGDKPPYDRLHIVIPSVELVLDIRTLDTSPATGAKP